MASKTMKLSVRVTIETDCGTPWYYWSPQLCEFCWKFTIPELISEVDEIFRGCSLSYIESSDKVWAKTGVMGSNLGQDKLFFTPNINEKSFFKFLNEGLILTEGRLIHFWPLGVLVFSRTCLSLWKMRKTSLSGFFVLIWLNWPISCYSCTVYALSVPLSFENEVFCA